MAPDVSRETPPTPASARGVFGDRLPVAERYVAWLADAGTVRGLIGPREVPRLWERHVLNSAVLADVIPTDATVADIGSGAGLPGLVLAIARPDLQVTLIEPLLRRCTFLSEVIEDLGLDNVTVRRGRAEEVVADLGGGFDVVTSRAVAPMERLAAWSLPLVRVGGAFLPMKGSTATEEIAAAQTVLSDLGAGPSEVLTLGAGVVDEEVTVVRMVKASLGSASGARQRTGGPRKSKGERRRQARRQTGGTRDQ